MTRADSQSLETIKSMMVRHGVKRIFMKPLAPNDNSKNQPYFGGDFSALNLLPIGKPVADLGSGLLCEPIIKAPLELSWLSGSGTIAPAPSAKLILYPQYPEVRLSGYLIGADRFHRPSDVLGQVRSEGRYLLLGVTENESIVGVAAGPSSRLAKDLRRLAGLEQAGVFYRIPLSDADTLHGRRALLLSEICRVSKRGWIKSKRLTKDLQFVPCNGTNCGGMTLEAELGIPHNSSSDPDFHGWEIKQHSVFDFGRPRDSVITLMTPEPTGGLYGRRGVKAFVEKYGYADVRGRPNRRNFGGIFRRGVIATRTQLTLELQGYDGSSKRIIDPAGGVALVDSRDNVAAFWRFTDVLAHWSKKHESAAYIPSITRDGTPRQYRYSSKVRLGRGTSVEHLLEAMYRGDVYYDPGIKIEGYPAAPQIKRRSQFRIKSTLIPQLYSQMEDVDACAPV